MDFSQYTGPSAEWLALEKDLPAGPDPNLSPAELKAVVNKARVEGAARELATGMLPYYPYLP